MYTIQDLKKVYLACFGFGFPNLGVLPAASCIIKSIQLVCNPLYTNNLHSNNIVLHKKFVWPLFAVKKFLYKIYILR
jgi:hypothetical protein